MCLLGCGPSGDNPVRHILTAHPGLAKADPFDRWPDGQLAPVDHTLQPGDFQEER